MNPYSSFRNPLILLCLLLFLPSWGTAQPVEVEVHSTLETVTTQKSSSFRVRINGVEANVHEKTNYIIETSNGVTDNYIHYVHFSMRGPVELEVDFLESPGPTSYWLRPGAFKIDHSRVDDTVSFKLHVPHYYVMETRHVSPGNTTIRTLILLADEFFENAPEPTDPNVVTASSEGFANDGSVLSNSDMNQLLEQVRRDPDKDIVLFEPGYYNFDNRGFGFRSQTGMFIKGGAYLDIGGYDARYDNSFWLRGRGVIDMNSETRNADRKFIVMDYSRNALIEGLVQRGAVGWNVLPSFSDDMLIKDWKIVNSWNRTNDDGVDTQRARRITVDKTFVCSSADNASDKAHYTLSITQDANTTMRNVTDITRRDAVSYSDAKAQKLGTESMCDLFDNFLFEDFFPTNNGGPRSHLSDIATVQNFTVRNWHIDGDIVSDLKIEGNSGRQPTTANINGMVLEDIYSYSSRQAKFTGYSPSNLVQNVGITNLYLGSDGFATSTADLDLTHTANFTVTTAASVWAAHDRYGLINEAVPLNGYAYHDTATWTKVSGPGNAVFTDATDPESDVTFDARGEYILRITADNNPGEFDELTVTVLDPNFTSEPKARFIMLPTFPTIGQSVTFDGSYSSDPDGTIRTYDWDFGDGTTLSNGGVSPTHSYAAEGMYSVSLLVTDNLGYTRKVHDYILVSKGQQPYGNSAHPVPGRVEAEDFDTGGTGISYADNSRGDNGPEVFGPTVEPYEILTDGSNNTLYPSISEVYRPLEEYVEECNFMPQPDIQASTDSSDPGGFELFDIDTKNGDNEWMEYTLDVSSAGTYEITFRVNPNQANVDRKFHLYIDGVKVIDNEVWGRSTNYIDKTVTVNFAQAGEHVLRVEPNGDIGSLNYMDFVLVGAPVPTACFSTTPASGLAPLEVTVDGSCSSGGTITNYRWDFGDGTIIESGTASESHTYAADGNYTITLTVTNDSANTGQTSSDVFVGNMLPTASFDFNPVNPDANAAVSFDASASSDADGSIVQYDWDFGDGTTLSDGTATPSHTYTSEDQFTVTLTVTDNQGDTAQTSKLVTVGNLPPTADLSSSASFAVVGTSIDFDATGSSDSDGTITQYDWDFGDGTMLNNGGATPSHSYSREGVFNVRVTVTDNDGAIDTDTVTVEIIDASGSWDFESGSGNRSFGQFGWVAYRSPRGNSSVINHTDTGAFPAFIKEDTSLGGSSLALIDADASSNDLAGQFYIGTLVSADMVDAVTFSFRHQSDTGSSGTAPQFLRVAIQIDNSSWYIAEEAFAESPNSATTSIFTFSGADWISWEDPANGFASVAAIPTSGGSPLTTGTITQIGLVMVSNRSGDYAKLDDLIFDAGQAAPDAATGLSALTVSATQIDLSWTDNSGDETGFKLQRAASSGGPWADVTTTAANSVSYSDTGLSADSVYYYQVLATNAAGDAPASNESMATTWSIREQFFADSGLAYDVNPAGNSDGDALSNDEEFIAGTNPNDDSSVFVADNIQSVAGNLEFDFETVSGRYYQVEFREALESGTWQPLSGYENVSGDGTRTQVTDTVSGKRFYRIRVSTTPW